MSSCKGCGAEIDWVITAQRKPMPVDPIWINVHEDPGGRHTVVTEDGRVVTGIQVGDAYEDGYVIGRMSHFATCPKSSDYRRRR